jgi:predicted nuclease of predicted toxin-antitoxin system
MAREGIRLYLDEDVRPTLAEILRMRGYDAVSCIELGKIGATDKEQMLTAIREERAILTHNIRDFVKLHQNFKKEHFGIILSDQLPVRTLVRRVLRLLSTMSQEDIKGCLIWLGDFD